MADVTGPISTLPGTVRTPPAGTMCDDHPKRPATHRLQGETNSFGCEMHDLCDECFAKMRRDNAEARIGVCDWCNQEAADLRAARDYDEGMCGPVYLVCGGCIRRRNDEARAELEEMSRHDDFDDYDDEPRPRYRPPPSPPIGTGVTLKDSKGRQHVDSPTCWCKPRRSQTQTAGRIVLIHNSVRETTHG